MIKIGVLRVLSTEDQDFLKAHGRLIEALVPVQTVSRCIQGHPQGLWNEEEEIKALPEIVSLGRMMAEEDGIAVLVVSCAADPGVRELRREVSIPVLGAGSAGAAMALALGRAVGVLGITDYILRPIQELLGERIVANVRPTGVHTALDLMTEEGRQGLMEAGQKLLEAGAEVILLACTGFSPIEAATLLTEQLKVPVIDPLLAAGLMAYQLARKSKRINNEHQKNSEGVHSQR